MRRLGDDEGVQPGQHQDGVGHPVLRDDVAGEGQGEIGGEVRAQRDPRGTVRRGQVEEFPESDGGGGAEEVLGDDGDRPDGRDVGPVVAEPHVQAAIGEVLVEGWQQGTLDRQPDPTRLPDRAVCETAPLRLSFLRDHLLTYGLVLGDAHPVFRLLVVDEQGATAEEPRDDEEEQLQATQEQLPASEVGGGALAGLRGYDRSRSTQMLTHRSTKTSSSSGETRPSQEEERGNVGIFEATDRFLGGRVKKSPRKKR